MELIAPWNKESLFLTVTNYNDSEEAVLATASVYKDQPFFNTAGGGVYIACESFRLSAFASDLGYIYRMISPNWFISGQQRGLSEEAESVVQTIIGTKSVLLNQNQVPVPEISLVVYPTPTLARDNSIQRHLDEYAKDLNDFRLAQNSIIEISPILSGSGSSNTRRYKLLQDPAENLVGPGMGANGLVEISCRVIPEFGNLDERIILSTSDNTGEEFIKNFVMMMSIEKSSVPANMTFRDLKVFFSSGIYLYGDKTTNSQAFDDDGEPVFKVMGPRKINLLGATELSDDVSLQPFVQMTCDNGKFFGIGQNIHWNKDDIPTWQEGDPTSALASGLPDTGPHSWCDEDKDYYVFIMCVEFASQNAREFVEDLFTDLKQTMGTMFEEHEGLAVFGDQVFFAYADSRPLKDSMHSDVEVELISGDAIDQNFGEVHVHVVERTNVTSQELIGRSFESQDYPVIGPNQMFQIFNPKDAKGENGWLLNAHANGGFQLEIKKDYDVFVIQKEFADLLGLDPRMISFENAASNQTGIENRVLVVPCQEPDENGHAEPKFATGNFSNYVVEGDINQFTTYDGSMLNPYTIKEEIGNVLRQINVARNESWFRLVNVYEKQISSQEYKRFRKDALVQQGSDGLEYVFHNVKVGDYLENLQMVSLESFAIFEGIQICVPSLPFQPMITSYSSGMRVLAELRLDFPVGPQAGPDGTNQGTNDFWVGDIHWSANNGHQYLQLSTAQQSIYNLEIQAQLVYRDANNVPPKPIWIAPKGGLFQCKIRLVAVK